MLKTKLALTKDFIGKVLAAHELGLSQFYNTWCNPIVWNIKGTFPLCNTQQEASEGKAVTTLHLKMPPQQKEHGPGGNHRWNNHRKEKKIELANCFKVRTELSDRHKAEATCHNSIHTLYCFTLFIIKLYHKHIFT